MPRSAEAPTPRGIVASGLCIGCGGCAAASGQGRVAMNRYGLLEAQDVPPTPDFAARCPFSPAARNETQIAADRFPAAPAQDIHLGRFEANYVGAASEPPFRSEGSSGGLVSWVAAELLRRGLVDGVAHVVPTDPSTGRYFAYRISRSVEAVREGAKSRYHPVELSAVLGEIAAVPGRYAVVGIPCFIKAVHLARAADPVLAERITHTLGLFCGHMKSKRMVESFAWQMEPPVPIEAVARVDYRRKDEGRPANWYTALLTKQDGGQQWKDWWHLADGDWGAGFFQAPPCDWCDDVVAETADIAFGDAWVEPYSSDGRGTNVVVVRSPELRDIVAQGMADGRLELEQVDADFIVNTQAAGFRHRHEGLAYRLTWARRGVRPVKRVTPSAGGLPLRRKLVYRLRYGIARWSHQLFAAARATGWHGLYLRWARTSLSVYAGVAWSRGRVGKLADRWLR